MSLTKKQEEGLKIAVERYKNKEKYTCIAGFAGSGKSYLIKYIVEELSKHDVRIKYATFTGKAAQVLIDKGLPATTLHKLLYDTKLNIETDSYIFVPKENIDCDIVIIDEISMAPKSIIDLLFSFKVYVLCCGDPGQIPPVDKDQDNHILEHPHIFLDEIIRQEADSGIIQLSFKIRNEQPYNNFETQDAIVMSKNSVTDEILAWADIILCSTNKTRVELNNRLRKIHGRDGLIESEDKMVCLKNNWDKISVNGNALTNGCIGNISNIYMQTLYVPRYINKEGKLEIIKGSFTTETNDFFSNIIIDANGIMNNVSTLSPRERMCMIKHRQLNKSLPDVFTYGYALTTHKSQGSQWDKVLIFEEGFPFDKEEHKKLLYTAVTRGAKKVVLVKKN